MICIDTTCDDEILQELRARTFAATVQKLRKSAGLVVGDKVEIFYDESSEGSGINSGINSISAAMLKHSAATVKRIKCLPLDYSLCSKQAIVVYKEIINDTDISKSPITIYLTQPCIAVDVHMITSTLLSSVESSKGENVSNMAAMYLQSMEYERISSLSSVEVTVDSISLVLQRGKHFFLTANEMVTSSEFSGRSKIPNLPTEL